MLEEHIPPVWPKAPPAPLPPGHVADDHFLHQFDRCADPKAAMAAHSALLLNTLIDVRRERIRHLEEVLQQLCDGEVPAKVAIQLHGVIRDLTE